MDAKQLKRRLIAADASQTEADYLSEIWIEDYFQLPATKPTVALLSALSERITDWRSERREFAGFLRENRQKRLESGYRGIAPDAPVILNGVTF